VLRTSFGTQARFTLENFVSFAPDSIYRSGVNRARAFAVSSEIMIELSPPSPIPAPVVRLNAPSDLGACNDLILDASGSTGSGGRPFQSIQWAFVSADQSASVQDNAANVKTVLQAAAAEGQTRVRVPRAQLEDGATYTVSVSLTNWLGGVGTSETASMTVSGLNLPSLSVLGGTTQQASRNQEFSLTARASARGCNASQIIPLEYSFIQSGGPTDISAFLSTTTRGIVIPAGHLFHDPSLPYTVVVSVNIVGDLTASTSASTVIHVGTQALQASIMGGSRVVSPTSALVIDGSQSSDPNNDELQAGGPSNNVLQSYAWTCTTSGGVCSDLTASVSTRTFTVSSERVAEFSGKQLTFKLTFTSNGKSASSTAQIDVASVPVPAVSIIGPLGSTPVLVAGSTHFKVDSSSRVVLLGTADSDQVQWSLASSSEEINDLLSTPSEQKQVVIRAGALVAGKTYTFSLSAIGSIPTAVGKSSITIVANGPPSTGTVSASAASGTALTDTIDFVAQQWVDDTEDLPLQFQFFVDSSGAVPSERELKEQTTGSPASIISSSNVLSLLVPTSSGNGNITVIVYVYDKFGSFAASHVQVESAPAVAEGASAEQVASFVEDAASLVSATLGEGDAEAAMSVAASLADVLNGAAPSSGSNQPIGEAAAQKARRTQLRQNILGAVLGAASSDVKSKLGAVKSLTSSAGEVSPTMVSGIVGMLQSLLGFGSGRQLSTSNTPLSLSTATSFSDVSVNLLNADSEAQVTGLTAAQQTALSSFRAIGTRLLVNAVGNEDASVIAAGLSGCLPQSAVSINMQSKKAVCQNGKLFSTGVTDAARPVQDIALCNAGSAEFFGPGAVSPVNIGGVVPGAAGVVGGAGSAVCSSEVNVQLLTLPKGFVDVLSGLQTAFANNYIGAPASSGLTVVADTTQSAPIIRAEFTDTSGVLLSSSDITGAEFVVPLFAKPAIATNTHFIKPPPAGSRRLAGHANFTEHMSFVPSLNNYEVTCPTDSAVYNNGPVMLTASCPMGDHDVQCSASQAGGKFAGQCPVSAFTAACIQEDSLNFGQWTTQHCTVQDLSNEHALCSCNVMAPVTVAFATVLRASTQMFTAAASPSPQPAPSTPPAAPSSSPSAPNASPSASPVPITGTGTKDTSSASEFTTTQAVGSAFVVIVVILVAALVIRQRRKIVKLKEQQERVLSATASQRIIVSSGGSAQGEQTFTAVDPTASRRDMLKSMNAYNTGSVRWGASARAVKSKPTQAART